MNKNKLYLEKFFDNVIDFLIDHENVLCLVEIGLCNIQLNLFQQDESNMY